MMKKRLTALLLVMVMAVSLFAGCSGNVEQNSGNTASQENAGTGETNSPQAPTETNNVVEDIIDMELYCLALMSTDGYEEIEAAINEITEKKIGVHVNMNLLDAPVYDSQISLIMAGNEQTDLLITVPIQSASFSAMVAQNQLKDITELMNEYAPETVALLGDVMKGAMMDGKIYAVPTYRILSSSPYAIMRKDILDELNLTDKARNLKSWTEYEEILKAVKDAQSTLPESLQTTAPLGNNDDAGNVMTDAGSMPADDLWAKNYGYDTLGDTFKIIYVDEATDTVKNYFETEDYYTVLKRVNRYYQEGYIYKDAAISQEMADNLMKNNVVFSFCIASELGVESVRKANTGYDVIAPEIHKIPLSTGAANKFTWTVPVTAKEPEAAVKFMNLMYTDPDIANLLVWGVEGRDYTLNAQGEAVKSESAVYFSNDFLWGNQFIAYPAAGQGGDFRQFSLSELKSTPLSKYFGCVVDTAPISNQLTSVNNVIGQYKAGLESGAVADLDKTYNEFLQALKDAGVDQVVSFYQEQLNAWLAAQ